jgi:hypothetical protein
MKRMITVLAVGAWMMGILSGCGTVPPRSDCAKVQAELAQTARFIAKVEAMPEDEANRYLADLPAPDITLQTTKASALKEAKSHKEALEKTRFYCLAHVRS